MMFMLYSVGGVNVGDLSRVNVFMDINLEVGLHIYVNDGWDKYPLFISPGSPGWQPDWGMGEMDFTWMESYHLVYYTTQFTLL